MKLKQLPEDFSVTESWRFDPDPRGQWFVYLMDKQKLSTFEAVERLRAAAKVHAADVSFCGLKDKQGRTTQLVAVRGAQVELQEPDLRLKPLGRTTSALSAANTTSNRFAVTVRDLSEEDVAKLASSMAEVRRIGVVDYFDSQRFGSLKHGQGFLVKDLMRGEHEVALKNFLARPSELDRTGDARVKQFWKENWGDWELRNPHPGAERYELVVRYLRKHPQDFLGAFLRTEPRWRGLQVFAYQSWLWNEGVKAYLRDVVGVARLVSIRYQAGTLLFPRELDGALARELRGRTFPLLAPGFEVRGSPDGTGGPLGAGPGEADAGRPPREGRPPDPLRRRGASAPRESGQAGGGRGAQGRAQPGSPAGEPGLHPPSRRLRHAGGEAALLVDAPARREARAGAEGSRGAAGADARGEGGGAATNRLPGREEGAARGPEEEAD